MKDLLRIMLLAALAGAALPLNTYYPPFGAMLVGVIVCIAYDWGKSVGIEES